MWKFRQIEPEDGSDTIDITYLTVGDWDLEIFNEDDGRFFIQAAHSCDGETTIGAADTLDSAKQMALAWVIQQLGEMLKACGAEGVWLFRGMDEVVLHYYTPEHPSGVAFKPLPPHELILLARFPSGDGKEAGIERV